MKKLTEAKKLLFEAQLDPEKFEERKKDYLFLYFAERAKYEKGFLANLTVERHRSLHRFLLPAVKISNRLQGHRLELLTERPEQTGKATVFAATHIGKSDIEMLCEVLGEHCYILTNGFEAMYHTFDGLALSLNGVIYFNHIDKADRNRAMDRMVEILKAGGNVLMFPEGAYNITPNIPVTPLNWGVVKAAQRADARIVPVAIEQYGKEFKVAVGSFDVSNYAKNDNGASIAAEELRGVLAGLKWDIWERMPMIKHADAEKINWDSYVKNQLKGAGDTVEDVMRERYQPKKR